MQLALDIAFAFAVDSTSSNNHFLAANFLLYAMINVIGIFAAYFNELDSRNFFLRGASRKKCPCGRASTLC